MIQPFFDFVEKFATDFSWRRLIILFSLIFMLGFVYFLYEAQTASSQLSKYERAIEIIKQSELMNPTDPNAKKVISNIYSGLNEITLNSSADLSYDIAISREMKQAIAGGAVWVLMALFFIPSLLRKTRTDAASIVGGCSILALLTGLGGYFLPVTLSTWIVYGLYPVGLNLSLFILLAYLGNKD